MPAETTRGFTLVEVLVALAVLAIAFAAVMRTLGAGIDLSADLRDRNVALWVAQNRLTERQIQHAWPAPDVSEGTSDMGGRQWRWRETVTTTPEAAMRRIEIEIRAPGNEQVLARLVGFLENPAP
jgi:general secretion pathway protein I